MTFVNTLTMNFKTILSFSTVSKIIPIIFLVTIFTYLNSSTYWVNLFTQSSVSIWALFGIMVGHWLVSFLPSVWSPSPQNVRVHLWALSLPLLLFWILYHQILYTWWTADDPALLEYIHDVSPWHHLVNKTRGLFYTPLQPLSLGLDYYFFGLQPSGFYWHHLLSFSLVLLLAYWVLKQFFPPLLASMTVSLFVVSVPTAHAAHYLMLRHYIEGLGFALLATWCYLRAVNHSQNTRHFWASIGSLWYLVACLAKEIYIPLPFILLTLPVSVFQQRLRQLWPFLITVVVYTGLRLYSVGQEDLFASYAERSTNWQDVLNLPAIYLKDMGWQSSWQWLPWGAVMVILLGLIWQKPYSLGAPMLAWLIAIVGPLWPILWRLIYLKYYLFMVAFLTSLACGLVWTHLNSRLIASPWRSLLINTWFTVLLFVSLLPTQIDQSELYLEKQARQVQGQFLWYNHTPQTVLIDDYYCAPLVNLRKKILNQPSGPNWCLVADCSCAVLYPGYTAWHYVNGQWQTQLLSPEQCGEMVALSLRVTLSSSSKIHWQLGPYTDSQGQYYVWVANHEEDLNLQVPPLPIPPQGIYTLTSKLVAPLKVLIKYQSSKGWITYSPPLVIDPKQVSVQGVVEVNWQRSDQH